MNRRQREKLQNHIVHMYVEEKKEDLVKPISPRVLPSQWKALEDAQLLILESSKRRQERMARLGIKE